MTKASDHPSSRRGELKSGVVSRKSPDVKVLAAGLYIVATPIGNARDITLRALDVLTDCDVIAAEDTRVTAKLLAIHGIQRPLLSYNDHNGERERPKILARLARGERVALVSDAGTPLISDPGFKLVREAASAGMTVTAIPGPSATLAGLAVSGLPTDRFLFAGFLPPKRGERHSRLGALKAVPATLVFFEAPQRLAETLSDMSEVFGDRPVAVARELTKLHEEIARGHLAALAEIYKPRQAPKGEITIVVGPPLETGPDFARIDQLLEMALAQMPLRSAVDLVSAALAAPRGEVYDRALEKTRGHDQGT